MPQTGAPAPEPSPPPRTTSVERAGGLWARIKEHKLLQWGLAYLAAALAIGEGQQILAQTFDWPVIAGRIILGLLIIGFPLVLMLAWYHGHRGLKRISAGELMIGSGVLVLAAVLMFVFIQPEKGSRGGAETRSSADAGSVSTAHDSSSANSAAPRELLPTATGVTLAVLPFVNMSDDKEQEYFSDGLSEELMNQLANIKDLRVTGRTSAFAFKGHNEDLRTIGEKLGVTNILEGSVRRSGDRLRVTAQLINAADGFHIWSNTYDKELTDVFAVQEEIGKAVADALQVTLGVGELAKAGTRNLAAYDVYLKGLAAMRAPSADSYRQARAFFREAVALDPKFAGAWVSLSTALSYLQIYAPQEAQGAMEEQAHALDRALEILPEDLKPFVEANKALIYRDFVAADRAFGKVTGKEFLSSRILLGFFLGTVGRNRDAVEVLRAEVAADPLSVSAISPLMTNLEAAGRNAEAEAQYRSVGERANVPMEFDRLMRLWSEKADAAAVREQYERFLKKDAGFLPVNAALGPVLERPAEARKIIAAAMEDPRYQNATAQGGLAQWATAFGDLDLAFAGLRRAVIQQKASTAVYLIWHPAFADFRKDPRFKDFVRDLGLVKYWRETGNWGDHCRPLGADDFECT